MTIIETVNNLRSILDTDPDRLLGFVPTMGALHDGHLSLVKEALKETDISVVSIFVNPTQFNDIRDLQKYPRNIERDINLLVNLLGDNDILFLPSYDELYSREQDFSLDLEGLDSVMEGEHRPGHFEGVVRVVKLLFEAVRPDKAYFGQKDFQQLSIIRKMVEKLEMEVEIVGCPILREDNGLAMSSRNERLEPSIREKAGIIYSTLNKHKHISELSDLPGVKDKIIKEIERSGDFRVEYLEVVDNLSLKPPDPGSIPRPGIKYFACIALFAGDIRLIDNVEFSFQIIKG